MALNERSRIPAVESTWPLNRFVSSPSSERIHLVIWADVGHTTRAAILLPLILVSQLENPRGPSSCSLRSSFQGRSAFNQVIHYFPRLNTNKKKKKKTETVNNNTPPPTPADDKPQTQVSSRGTAGSQQCESRCRTLSLQHATNGSACFTFANRILRRRSGPTHPLAFTTLASALRQFFRPSNSLRFIAGYFCWNILRRFIRVTSPVVSLLVQNSRYGTCESMASG